MTKRVIGGALLATPESNPARTEEPSQGSGRVGLLWVVRGSRTCPTKLFGSTGALPINERSRKQLPSESWVALPLICHLSFCHSRKVNRLKPCRA
jgi:hypothetical protein